MEVQDQDGEREWSVNMTNNRCTELEYDIT